MRERTEIFSIIILGYGIGIVFFKSKKECNPNKKEYSSDGSIEKYSLYKSLHRYSNPYINFHFLWNYGLLFRLFLRRE